MYILMLRSPQEPWESNQACKIGGNSLLYAAMAQPDRLEAAKIQPAKGTLGIMTVGQGAVATTLMAGVAALKEGITTVRERDTGRDLPIDAGSVTQMGRIRLGPRTDISYPLVRDFVPLASINQLAFFSWDNHKDNALEVAERVGIVDRDILQRVSGHLSEVRPLSAVFDPLYVGALKAEGIHIKTGSNRMDLAEQIRADIQGLKSRNAYDRAVMVFCASTERTPPLSAEHQDIASFERALLEGSENISPSMIYAYAAIQEGVPFINGTPGRAVDFPALVELANERNVPIAGKDFKTGQTLVKTILAPGFFSRMLGLLGWNSYNVLGNNDGYALSDPDSNKSKIISKGEVLEDILRADLFPGLYEGMVHQVGINYYKPAGDRKTADDIIDLFTWGGKRMRMKIAFECEDSSLAAPVVLDLALFMDLAQRAGQKGIQEWLSFYFKAPQTAPGLPAVNNLFEQEEKLHNNLRHLMGEKLITHLGREYYD